MTKHFIVLAALAASGCTAVDYTVLPTQVAPGAIFVTAESLKEPYESMGIVQITRRGVRAFGFADPAGTDLEAAIREIEPQIRQAGADGLMNARVQMTQYTTAGKIAGAILFFAPLPSEVTITGELVKLRRNGAAPAVSPAGAPL